MAKIDKLMSLYGQRAVLQSTTKMIADNDGEDVKVIICVNDGQHRAIAFRKETITDMLNMQLALTEARILEVAAEPDEEQQTEQQPGDGNNADGDTNDAQDGEQKADGDEKPSGDEAVAVEDGGEKPSGEEPTEQTTENQPCPAVSYAAGQNPTT